MMEAITIEDLASIVKIMRDCQKDFFRERKPSDLQKSKHAEKMVDDAVKKILTKSPDNQTTLEL